MRKIIMSRAADTLFSFIGVAHLYIGSLGSMPII
jgi:hypothetical protein